MWYWLGLAAGLLIIEVTTGTIYLLVVAAGFCVAGVLAALGLSLTWQLASCSVGILWALFLFKKWGKQKALAQQSAQLFDYGQQVTVTEWDAQGMARIAYRGSQWNARLVGSPHPQHLYSIKAVEGTVLLLQSISSAEEATQNV